MGKLVTLYATPYVHEHYGFVSPNSRCRSLPVPGVLATIPLVFRLLVPFVWEDIGAQDSKVIHLDAAGCRTGFKMNRKCAAGTGAFLEEIALRLDLPVAALNGLAERSTKEVTLGSFCTVFTATEILARIRAGEKVEDIVKGAFRSVVKRILEMDTVDGTLVMTGGVVAYNPLLVTLVEEAFGRKALVPPEPQRIGAWGRPGGHGSGPCPSLTLRVSVTPTRSVGEGGEKQPC